MSFWKKKKEKVSAEKPPGDLVVRGVIFEHKGVAYTKASINLNAATLELILELNKDGADDDGLFLLDNALPLFMKAISRMTVTGMEHLQEQSANMPPHIQAQFDQLVAEIREQKDG